MADQQTTPSKGTPGTTPNGKVPSNQDAMFFFFIVKNMKSKADVDWAGVAAEHGFKNAEVAKVCLPSQLDSLSLSHVAHVRVLLFSACSRLVSGVLRCQL